MARSIPEATLAIGRVRAMPMGRARAEASAREARLIEADGPDEVKAYALESLVEALTWSGDPLKAMPPFVKLLRWWDSHPEMFDTGDQNILFWEFGWILGDLARTISVPKERVNAALDDMERRFSLASRGVERVWNNRLEWALISQSPDLDQVFNTWLTMPIDDEDSCAACHPEHEALYLIEKTKLDQAIAVLEKAAASDLTCSREPASLLALLAWCYIEAKRIDDVEQILTRILVEFSQATSVSMTVPYSCLFEVYARGGLVEAALALLASFSSSSAENTQYTRLECLRHLISGASGLIKRGFGKVSVMVDGNTSTISEWLDELEAEAVTLSEAFDARHGNTAQAERLAKALAAKPTSRKIRRPEEESDTGDSIVKAHAPDSDNATDSEPKSRQDRSTRKNRKLDNQTVTNAKLTNNSVSDIDVAPDDPITEGRRTAEALADNGDWTAASATYIQTSALAAKKGLLKQAGWCLAEAARIEQTKSTRDPGTGYDQALSLLIAGGATLEDVSRVLVAWAPNVTAKAYPSFMKYANHAYPSPAKPACGDDIESLMTRLVHPAMVGSPLLRRYILAWSALKDAQARVQATWGNDKDRIEAIVLTRDAASRFSMLGRSADAAHGWWLAASLSVHTGGNAEADYRLARSAFTSMGEPGRVFLMQVLKSYATHLMHLGRPEDAERILSDDEE